MIKKIFCDVDGTLCTPQGTISQYTIKKIQQSENNGIDFILTTGRSYCGLKKIFEICGFTLPCICHMGADVHNEHGDFILSQPLSHDAIKAICAVSKAHANSGLCGFTNDCQLIDCDKKQFLYNIFGFSEIPVGSPIEQWYCDLRETRSEDDFSSSAIYKMEFHTATASDADALMKALKKIKTISPCLSKPTNIEITSGGISKGKIIENICAMDGTQRDEIVTIGDSFNDLSMLEGFPHSVAMGNAPQSLKDLCVYVTDDNAHDGVGKIIDRILKGEIQ